MPDVNTNNPIDDETAALIEESAQAIADKMVAVLIRHLRITWREGRLSGINETLDRFEARTKKLEVS